MNNYFFSISNNLAMNVKCNSHFNGFLFNKIGRLAFNRELNNLYICCNIVVEVNIIYFNMSIFDLLYLFPLITYQLIG